MTTTLSVLVALCLLAFVCEWIDSSLGMGYGTILSPALITLGFPVLTVVPAILLSQALGGLSATYFHHSYKNAHFKIQNGAFSEDLKTVLWISSLGIFASIFASFVGVKILSKTELSTYIGILVLLMGFFILIGFTFRYSPQKMVLVGLVSAFNKGISGGGFGPLVTGGQMMLGNKHNRAVGITTFSEAPICIAGFLAYMAINGIERPEVVVALTVGSIAASPLGAHTTMKLSKKYLKEVVAFLLVLLGILTLMKTYGIINIPVSM